MEIKSFSTALATELYLDPGTAAPCQHNKFILPRFEVKEAYFCGENVSRSSNWMVYVWPRWI